MACKSSRKRMFPASFLERELKKFFSTKVYSDLNVSMLRPFKTYQKCVISSVSCRFGGVPGDSCISAVSVGVASKQFRRHREGPGKGCQAFPRLFTSWNHPLEEVCLHI